MTTKNPEFQGSSACAPSKEAIYRVKVRTVQYVMCCADHGHLPHCHQPYCAFLRIDLHHHLFQQPNAR